MTGASNKINHMLSIGRKERRIIFLLVVHGKSKRKDYYHQYCGNADSFSNPFIRLLFYFCIDLQLPGQIRICPCRGIISLSTLVGFTFVLGAFRFIHRFALVFCSHSQVFLNYHRKSVVGLSFDFLAYNLVAFACYTVYNFSMLYIPEIQREYQEMFHQHVPVHSSRSRDAQVVINDLFFSAHAMLITSFTIVQCFIYERNGQRVSKTAIVLLCLIFLVILLCVIGVVFHLFSWLNWLIVIIVFSNIKLVISFIKYIPQLVFNCRRKSTYPESAREVA